MNIFIIFLSFVILSTTVCANRNAAEMVKNVQDVCLAYNTCNNNTIEPKCRCDEECSVYGDCCLDSSFNHLKIVYQLHAECIDNYYFISKCPSWWGNETVKHKCETEINLKDSKSFLKVFSLYTLLSYKNYYCALCNEDNEKIYWWPRIECLPPDNQLHVDLNKLYYDQHFSSWGIKERNLKGNKFIPCTIYNEPRANLKDFSFRKCNFSINKCADKWKDNVIREKCYEFQGIVHVDSVPYRNVYCALCNWFHIEEISCEKSSTFLVPKARGGADIRDLFKVPKCKKGYVYDAKHNTCRKLVCLPFQELVKNKCVRKKKKEIKPNKIVYI